jgi:uncharacterized membrane protein
MSNKRCPNRGETGFEKVLGILLIAGVSAAAVVILLGGVFHVIQNGASKADYSVFRETQGKLGNLKEIAGKAFSFRSAGLIQLGVLILILTPIARVVFSFAAFVVRKEHLYTIITLLVLALLILGFIV